MNQKMLATSSVSQPNSYQRYHPFRWLLLFVHCLLILGVLTILSKNWYWFFVCALSHLLIILNDSACYAGHCQSVLATTSWQIDCSECGCRRWIRMKHCYRCRKCVHKYDHHCLFLDMCIGEFNQKYYILFLWTYLCNLLAVSQEILSWLPPEVTVDERGIEHISWRYFWYALTMIACLFNLTLIVYLCGLHTFMSLVN